MTKVLATLKNGQVVLDDPVDWPDGARLEVSPLYEGSQHNQGNGAGEALPNVRRAFVETLNDPDSYGIDEAFWPLTPEETQVLLDHMDAAQPLQLTAEQQDEIETDRLAFKNQQKKLYHERMKTIDGLFE